MKQYTTQKQFNKLIELGFSPPELYSNRYTIGELIALIPQSFKILEDDEEEEYHLSITKTSANYELYDEYGVFIHNWETCRIRESELIDCLFETCILLKERKII